MHVDARKRDNAIDDLVRPGGSRLNVVRLQSDLARLQRAVEGTQHSGAGRPHDVVDGERQVLARVQIEVSLDGAVDPEVDLRSILQPRPAVNALDLPDLCA